MEVGWSEAQNYGAENQSISGPGRDSHFIIPNIHSGKETMFKGKDKERHALLPLPLALLLSLCYLLPLSCHCCQSLLSLLTETYRITKKEKLHGTDSLYT